MQFGDVYVAYISKESTVRSKIQDDVIVQWLELLHHSSGIFILNFTEATSAGSLDV